jgi:hypothetical protein
VPKRIFTAAWIGLLAFLLAGTRVGARGAEPEAGSPSAEERIAALEQQLGKLNAAAEKKKKDDAKKPSLTISGQVQADNVYFGQDAESRVDVGDLQDGSQFRRLRLGEPRGQAAARSMDAVTTAPRGPARPTLRASPSSARAGNPCQNTPSSHLLPTGRSSLDSSRP